MAEAFFNRLVRRREKAKSAGTQPAERLDDSVTTMGCRVEEVCPASFVETEDWAVEDPRDKPIE